MRSSRLTLLLASASVIAALAPLCALAQGESQSDAADAAVAEFPFSAPRAGRRASYPVEQILRALEKSRGLSFIFDSRVLAGKFIRSLGPSAAPETALADALAETNLQLHEVAPKTFAITEQEKPKAPAPQIELAAPEELPVDTILVTGAYSTIGAPAGAKHILSVDLDDLIFRGSPNTADAIFDLPQAIATISPANTTLYATAAGLSFADLRGLGEQQTLVLVNGRRRTITAGGNGNIRGVDLNTIAAPLLERIEIFTASGSARFGASAAAGTANFVTRSNMQGIEAGAQFDISERGDAKTWSAHAIGGVDLGENLNITAGFNYVRNEGLLQVERRALTIPYAYALNGVRSNSPDAEFLPGFGGSSLTPQGSFQGVILNDGTFHRFPQSLIPDGSGAIAPFIGAPDQTYDFALTQSLIPPDERMIGMLSINHDASDLLRFHLDVNGAVTRNTGQLAPLPTGRTQGPDSLSGEAARIPLSNPSLPQSIIDYVNSVYGGAASEIVYDHRYTELGPRIADIRRRSLDIAAGAEFGDEDSLRFSATYRYGVNDVSSTDHNRIDVAKTKIALDPVACAVAAGCAPVDYFTGPEVSDAALDFISIPEIERKLVFDEHEVALAASSLIDFGDAHSLAFSAGAEFRRTAFTDDDGIPAGVLPAGVLTGGNSDGALTTTDLFTGIEADLFKENDFPGGVSVALAWRLTESSAFQTASNFEASIDWRPTPGLSLYARRHIGARPPDVIELYYRDAPRYLSFSDPCSGPPGSKSATRLANCSSAGVFGVPSGFMQTAPLASTAIIGNSTLGNEKNRSTVLGISLAPSAMFDDFPGRLEFNAAWIDIEIEDRIEGSETQLLECYESVGFSSPACWIDRGKSEPAIIRDATTRQIIRYDQALQNNGSIEWRGLDLEMRYSIEPENEFLADRVWVNLLHTYTDRVVTRNEVFGADRLDGLLRYPHHRTLATLGADFGDLSLVAYANRRGKALTARVDRAEARVPAATYIDLTGQYRIGEDSFIQLAVRNLTDRQPDITAFNEVGNFAPEFYDPIGRRFSISVRGRF